MGVTAADIKWYLTGASSDGGAQADPDAALGNYRSSTEITNDSIENLFDNVTGSEATSGDIEHRCICVKNENGSSENWYNVKFFIQTNTPSGDSSIEFAVEAPEDGNSNGSAQTIGDESTAPTVGTGSVSAWDSGTTYDDGVGVNQGAHDANLDAGELIFLWLKRSISSGASAYDADSVVMRAQGEATA
jgi:hypothetical protein